MEKTLYAQNMQRKGKGPAYKMVGIRVPESVKTAFETAADELDSNSSLVGHVLMLEFLREVAEIRAKGGRVVWPIKLRVAYDPKPEIRFGDDDAETRKVVPMAAEGSGQAPAPPAVTEKGGAGTVYRPDGNRRKTR